jgi:hypothetical protein
MSDAILRERPDGEAPVLIASPPIPRPAPAWRTSRVGVALASVGIGVVAVASRAYELRDVPRLTDETDEVMRGLGVERGKSDVAVVSPRMLTRLDKDFTAEAPPGEVEARGRRRAPFAIVRISGQAEDRHDFDLVAASERPVR